MSPSVLTVGLDPAPVDEAPSSRAAFPDIDAGRDRLEELGFTVDVCLLDYGRTAEEVYRAALSAKNYDIVMIGAGVRLDPALTPLFEALVNVTHKLAPGPTTTPEAVQRWQPERKPLVP